MATAAAQPADPETPGERVIRRVTEIPATWGIRDGCGSIYAVLIAADHALGYPGREEDAVDGSRDE